MKPLLLAISLSLAALTLSLAPGDADAKRLGAGKPAGMQRAAPTNATPQNAPAQSAAPKQAAAPAAAPPVTPPKRNWMGPLAGLAAGLGIAALFSHFGMGGALGGAMGSLLTMALLAVVAVVVIRFVMSRMRSGAGNGPQLAGAGAGAGAPFGGNAWQAPAAQPAPMPALPANLSRGGFDGAPAGASTLTGLGAAAVAPAIPATLPGGMATAEFERLAKMVFIRLQAANDSGNVEDLRKFTTPELFASLRLDMQERGAARQQTDVVQIDAQVVDTAHENNQDIVSVRFQGLIREVAETNAEPFKELWHLVRPADGSADWAIAGITPEDSPVAAVH